MSAPLALYVLAAVALLLLARGDRRADAG